MPNIQWLPPEIIKQENQSEADYIDLLYDHFMNDFITTKPSFRGISLALKKHPKRDNKEATFWHMITKGEKELTRTIDYSRSEKLPWIKPTIENESRPEVLVWENKRKCEQRIVLWIKSKDYVASVNFFL